MKLSRERKFFGIICALAVLALIVDRTLLADGTAAEDYAADPSTLLVTSSGKPSPGASLGAATIGNASGRRADSTASAAAISDLLAQMAERNRRQLEHTPDAFQPGAAWAGPVVDPVVHVTPDVQVENFAKRKLNSLVASGRGGAGAMVENKIVRVGQSLDGFTLIAVDDRSALFEGRASRVRLSLSGDVRITPLRSDGR